MKNNVIKIGVLSMLLVGFASCTDKNAEQAEKKVDSYVTYVDSLGNVETVEVKNNWAAIDAKYQTTFSEAELAVAEVKENEMMKTKLEASKAKYDLLKAQVDEQIAKEKMASNPNQILRNKFFGEGKLGEDMNFSWVNKDNILKVYEDFFQSYKDNKGNFTREDYDEVKLMYAALDSRKNTVEKEGLTTEDNNKIASIKFKFAPMFKVNRIGAKARENEAAKE